MTQSFAETEEIESISMSTVKKRKLIYDESSTSFPSKKNKK